MNKKPDHIITKTDFLLYLQAPRHLWARKNGCMDVSLSDFDQLLIDQGYQVENLARQYLEAILLLQSPGTTLLWQSNYADGPFEARMDALIYRPESDIYDLYEIKSSTSIAKEHLYDITYQALILKNQVDTGRFFLLHLNKDYIFSGEMDLNQLFVCEDVTEKVDELIPAIELLRQEALQAAQTSDPALLEVCLKPKECPCPEICHPNLPEFSIYDIPRLSQKKKKELLDLGILEAKDIPLSFGLNEKQMRIAERARTHSVFIDTSSLQTELRKIVYPIYFLDYETCISAIPQFAGYHSQQQIVFQYSLHRMDYPGAELIHTWHISTGKKEPTNSLLQQLKEDIGREGTVIVWNKAFEITRNIEMAQMHPGYETFLLDINTRIYDLGDIVNLGYYIHPGFKGSWSIKKVLPVLVPELSYNDLAINKGDMASITWWNITFGNLSENEKEKLLIELEKYCRLDTLAMVEIFKAFRSIV